MEDSRACIHCYSLNTDGSGTPLELSAITPDDPRLIWIHLNAHHASTRKFLKEQQGLHPLLMKSMLAEETRPRLEENANGTFLILRGLNYNPGPEPEDLVSLRVWISGNRVISLSRRKGRAIADLDERIRDSRGPRHIGEFVSILCMCLNDGIEPALQSLEDNLDRLEDLSADTPEAGLRNDLALVRKQATLFRRHLSPQRDVVARLKQLDAPWNSIGDKWSIHDSFDRLTRFLEELDAIRERSQILQDEIYNAMSARLNRNIYVLSVITVIFMPLTFISGLLGMNVEGIPGATHPHAFAFVCAVAMAIALVQLFIFRRLKWF